MPIEAHLTLALAGGVDDDNGLPVLIGVGWTVRPPEPQPMTVHALIYVPREQAGIHSWRLRLAYGDESPIRLPNRPASVPAHLTFENEAEVNGLSDPTLITPLTTGPLINLPPFALSGVLSGTAPSSDRVFPRPPRKLSRVAPDRHFSVSLFSVLALKALVRTQHQRRDEAASLHVSALALGRGAHPKAPLRRLLERLVGADAVEQLGIFFLTVRLGHSSHCPLGHEGRLKPVPVEFVGAHHPVDRHSLGDGTPF
jgi:hypothetical protein